VLTLVLQHGDIVQTAQGIRCYMIVGAAPVRLSKPLVGHGTWGITGFAPTPSWARRAVPAVPVAPTPVPVWSSLRQRAGSYLSLVACAGAGPGNPSATHHAGVAPKSRKSLDLDVAEQNELFDVARAAWAQAGKPKPQSGRHGQSWKTHP
jgi:hypothetical protein